MSKRIHKKAKAGQGIRVLCRSSNECRRIEELLSRHDLTDKVLLQYEETPQAIALQLVLHDAIFQAWIPNHDTTRLTLALGLDTTRNPDHLEREILLTLLASPVPVDFPSGDEFFSALAIRRNIVHAGRCTELDFHTDHADRPVDCWRDDEERGFVILPCCSLIDALRKATQPEPNGKIYAFSCYRATEYVILLGVAEELAQCNPPLLAQLQRQCEMRMIRSGKFQQIFLHEYGAQETPIPTHYYVPGDRVWFRNPDEQSSDVAGFEGSWVLYLGGGLFTNFWRCDQHYTLSAKCLEIYHWRHGVVRNEDGISAIDESVVKRRIEESMANEAEMTSILAEMMQLRQPKGCYGQGGCIDTTREGPCWVCPGTSDLRLPLC